MSSAGLVLIAVWFIANWRTTKWINYWQSKLAAFEHAEPIPAEIGIFSGPDWEQMVKFPVKFDYMIVTVIVVIAALWLSFPITRFLS